MRVIDEVATVQRAHQSFVDGALIKVEPHQVTMAWKARRLHLIVNRAHLALGHLSLEQSVEHRLSAVPGW
jgi:hypothetical protein